MRRLIIINLILLIALNILPKEVKVEAKEDVNVRKCSQMNASEQIASRSSEPRQENSTENDKIISKPTEISQRGIDFIKSFERLFDHSKEIKRGRILYNRLADIMEQM